MMAHADFNDVDERVLEQALYWYDRVLDDASTESESEALASWLAEDPQHYEVFARLERMESDLDVLAREPATPANENHRSWARPVITGVSAAAAALVLSLGAMWAFKPAAPVIPNTIVAEATRSEQIRLDDGSVVTLAPNSSASARFEDDERRILDFTGLAYFDVAPDPARPFTIDMADGEIVVVGTAFEVLSRGDRTEVTVTEGQVTFVSDDGAPYAVIAGKRLTAQPGGPVQVTADARADDAVWYQGQLRFENANVATMVKTINRYFGEELFFVDPSVADRTFRGILILESPDQIASDLALAFELVAKREGVTYTLR